jgi:hypothetical protein
MPYRTTTPTIVGLTTKGKLAALIDRNLPG